MATPVRFHVRWFATILASLMLSSCASVPMAPPEESEAAKSLAVPTGKALVYLYRPTPLGTILKFRVIVNGQEIGSTVVRTYFLIESDPGELNLISQGENTATLKLKVEANKRYYVHQGVNLGITLRVSMELVAPEVGEADLQACNLIRHVRL